MNMFQSIRDNIIGVLRITLALPRLSKRVIVVFIDISVCILTVWLAFYLRLGEFVSLSGINFIAVAVSITFLLPTFLVFGQYRIIFRYSGLKTMYAVLMAISVYGLLYASVITFIGISGIPRTIGLIQPLLLFFAIVGFRTSSRYFLDRTLQNRHKTTVIPRALVYGAGSVGRQLVSALENSHNMQVVGFLDDDDRLHGNVLNNQLIFSPDKLADLIKSKSVTHVLLAIPSASKRRQKKILEEIRKYPVSVRSLPSVNDLADGRVTISGFRDPDIQDLLGREAVQPNHKLLSKKIATKVVLVTGAGGSIGGELCRQIIKLNPKKLLLVEISEYGLYVIHTELENMIKTIEIKNTTPSIVPLLASVQDKNSMRKIFDTWQPDTVYHAAAYKHVPLVEHNLVEGLKNNVLGTLITAQMAIENGISDFVLISTDKAIRPTNIMGASKRLAELCLQALWDQQEKKSNDKDRSDSLNKAQMEIKTTKLSIVRFGNVLDSSGSVIPRFRKQIRDGGPVTLTHPEITRYFMTITEASQLVIQATAMAKGGDVFVLDMGDPIKIADLAQRMIQLSGFKVYDHLSPDGDIEIIVTGLRPGEKLYEELLLGDSPELTMHPKIYRAKDPFVPWNRLESEIETLKLYLKQNKVEVILEFLQKFVTGYKPNDEIVDWIYSEQSHSRNNKNKFENLN